MKGRSKNGKKRGQERGKAKKKKGGMPCRHHDARRISQSPARKVWSQTDGK